MHDVLGDLRPDPERSKLMSSAWSLIQQQSLVRTSYNAQLDAHLQLSPSTNPQTKSKYSTGASRCHGQSCVPCPSDRHSAHLQVQVERDDRSAGDLGGSAEQAGPVAVRQNVDPGNSPY